MIFPSTSGTPTDQPNLHRDFKRVLKKAGLPNYEQLGFFRRNIGGTLRKIILPLILKVLLLFGASPPLSTSPETSEDEKKLKNLLDEFVNSINSGDVERWLDLWLEDGIQFPDHAPPNYGFAAIRAANAPGIIQYNVHMQLDSDPTIEVLGDTAYCYGLYSFRAVPREGGETIEFSGKFLSINKKQLDGSWKIAIDCFNSNDP